MPADNNSRTTANNLQQHATNCASFWDTQLATFLWHIRARTPGEADPQQSLQRVSRIWAGAAPLPGNNATRGNKSTDIELTTRRPTGQLGNCQTAAAAANAKTWRRLRRLRLRQFRVGFHSCYLVASSVLCSFTKKDLLDQTYRSCYDITHYVPALL